MHKVFIVCLVGIVGVVASADVLRLSEPVASDRGGETFGAALNTDLPAMGLGELVNNADDVLGKDVLIETRVGKVCQKKGCFFVATEGALAIRVSFKDYGFFVPTDSGGKDVTLVGQLVQRDLSPEQAAHFNADIRDGAATLSPGSVFEIVAEAVRIPSK